MHAKKKIGSQGESLAADFLLKLGYQIIDTNVQLKRGEIDIVAKDEDQLVFVEVKTRTSRDMGIPESGMTPQKCNALRSAAYEYLDREEILDDNIRFDVIAIELDEHRRVSACRHHIGVELE